MRIGDRARHLVWVGVTLAALTALAAPATAQKKYGPGVSDTEIRIGNTAPYSGPISAYSLIAKTEAAYFKKINDEGGINGRKISYFSYDDAATPAKTVEQARKLVDSDDVLMIFSALGTAPASSIQKYLNDKKVPHMMVATGAAKWGDPVNFPWVMGWQPNYRSEGRIYAKYIMEAKPDGKIGVLYQNDDFGKDVLAGLREGLGAKADSMIVAQEGYEISEPTMDSHIVKLKAAGADVFVNFSTVKFAAQAIKKIAELGWKPLQILNNVSNSIGGVLAPAGLENSVGIVSTAYLKDATDPAWKDDAGLKDWTAFMIKYLPDGDRTSALPVQGYTMAQALVVLLRQCGDDLTRENVMKQAASFKDVPLPLLLPGIKMNTSATDFFPLEDLQMMRFNGKTWERFGPVISGHGG